MTKQPRTTDPNKHEKHPQYPKVMDLTPIPTEGASLIPLPQHKESPMNPANLFTTRGDLPDSIMNDNNPSDDEIMEDVHTQTNNNDYQDPNNTTNIEQEHNSTPTNNKTNTKKQNKKQKPTHSHTPNNNRNQEPTPTTLTTKNPTTQPKEINFSPTIEYKEYLHPEEDESNTDNDNTLQTTTGNNTPSTQEDDNETDTAKNDIENNDDDEADNENEMDTDSSNDDNDDTDRTHSDNTPSDDDSSDEELDLDEIQTLEEYLQLYPKIQTLIGNEPERINKAFVTWRESDPTNDTWGVSTPPNISHKYWSMHQTWLPQNRDANWFRLRQDEKVDKNKALLTEWLSKTIFKHNKNLTIMVFDYETFQSTTEEDPPAITKPEDIDQYAADDLNLLFHGMEFSKYRKGHPIRFIVGHDDPYRRFEKVWKSDYGIYPCDCTASDPVTLGWFLYSHPTYDHKALE